MGKQMVSFADHLALLQKISSNIHTICKTTKTTNTHNTTTDRIRGIQWPFCFESGPSKRMTKPPTTSHLASKLREENLAIATESNN
jgi:hypothetical protein